MPLAGAAATLSKAGKRKAGGLALYMSLEGCSEVMVSEALHQCMMHGPYPAVQRLTVDGHSGAIKTCCSGFGTMLGLAFPALNELKLANLDISGTGLFCGLLHCKQLCSLSMSQLKLDPSALSTLRQIKRWAPGLTSIDADHDLMGAFPLEQYATQVQDLDTNLVPSCLSSCTNLVKAKLASTMDRAVLQALCSLHHLQHVTVWKVEGLHATGNAPGATLAPIKPWHTLKVSYGMQLQDLPLLPLTGLQHLDLTGAGFAARVASSADAVTQVMRAAGAALSEPASVTWDCARIVTWPTEEDNEDGEEEGPSPAVIAAALSNTSCLLQRQDAPGSLLVQLAHTQGAAFGAAEVAALGQGLASVDWANHDQPITELQLGPVRVDGAAFWSNLRTAVPPSLQTLHLGLCAGAHNIAALQLGVWCATASAPSTMELFISRGQGNEWDEGVRQALQEVQQTLKEAATASVSLKVHWDPWADVRPTESDSESEVEGEDGVKSDYLEGEDWFVDEVEEGEVDERLLVGALGAADAPAA